MMNITSVSRQRSCARKPRRRIHADPQLSAAPSVGAPHCRLRQVLRQYLYSCTSKESKLSTVDFDSLRAKWDVTRPKISISGKISSLSLQFHRRCQYVYVCTSKASTKYKY